MLSKPLFIFDGDCGFCKKWVYFLQKQTRDNVYYKSFQSLDLSKLQVKKLDCQNHVVLLTPDNKRFTAAQAVLKTLTFTHTISKFFYFLYGHLPGVKQLSECIYKGVAKNRSKLFWLNPPSTYRVATQWLLNGMFIIYALAFLSLFSQSLGLFGANGIVPIADTINVLTHNQVSFWQVPSLFSLCHNDLFIKWMPLFNVGLSLLAIKRSRKVWASVWLWFCYVSFINVGSPFMNFQWDVLLTEAGFLHILLCLWPSRLVLLGFQWLVFKLMLGSALVKWVSGDTLWRSFDALSVHFWTQPLPNIMSWYVHQLPSWCHKVGVGFMFFVEFVCPWLIWLGRIPRLIAALCIIELMGWIFFTGNYGFFNVLVGLLALSLIDDSFLKSKLLKFKQPKLAIQGVVAVIIMCFVWVGIASERQRFSDYRLNAVETTVLTAQQPWHIINGYGLFAVMTKNRDEIKIEGSLDGINWKPYPFKFKPNEPTVAPQWVAPHQPRLDWQMWFAALGDYKSNQWLLNVMGRLVENKQDVIGLFAKNPFEKTAPTYIRAMRYNYAFTNLKTKQATGQWWLETLKEPYTPVFQVKQ